MSVPASLMDGLRPRAASLNKRVLFPEHNDPRVLGAVRELQVEGLCEPVLLCRPRAVGLDVEVFSELPDADHWREMAIAELLATRNVCTFDLRQARRALQNPLLLAAVLLRIGYVDGGVAGAAAKTADVVRAGIRGLGLAPGVGLVSSAFLMEFGGRVLTFGDCAVNPRPGASQLAQIAIDSAQTHRIIAGEEPRVALLSFSTKGSAQHEEIDIVRRALVLVRQRAPHLIVDGELQFDAAYVPSIASCKAPGSPVAGGCNVYIFPNLSAGNIGYKIAERMAGARAIGPVLQGLAKPWLDLSRGCGREDVVNCAVISALLADWAGSSG